MDLIKEKQTKEIEEKLEKAGEEWNKVQKEWQKFKKDWWRVFSIITSVMFFISVVRNGFRLELYLWLFLMVVFTVISLYQYKQKKEELGYLKKFGFLKKEKENE